VAKIQQITEKNIKAVLKNFISDNFLPSSGFDTFDENDSFMEKGIIDSTGVLELIGFIEERFKIRVEDEEIIPENLDSLSNLIIFIKRKLNNAGSRISGD
jgi:acyl carrier protein